MITKIKSIQNMATYNNFNWDSNGELGKFKDINIIYGRNYSGKTTLSRIIRSFEQGLIPKNYENPKYELELMGMKKLTQNDVTTAETEFRVFNEDFVLENLGFFYDVNKEIESFAVLGSENSETVRKIAEIKGEIGVENEENSTGLNKKIWDARINVDKSKESLEKAEYELENKCREVALNNSIGIKYQPQIYGDQNYTIKKLKDDIESIKNKNYVKLSTTDEHNYRSIVTSNDNDLLKKLPVTILNFNEINQSTNNILTKVVSSKDKIAELLDDAYLEEWLKKGLSLNKRGEICKFCGNIISDSRLREIKNHFDEVSLELDQNIEDMIGKIEDEEQIIKELERFNQMAKYTTVSSELNDLFQKLKKYVELYSNELQKIIILLKQKKCEKVSVIELTDIQDYSKSLIELYEAYNKVVENYNKDIGSKNNKVVEYKKKLRLNKVYDFYTTYDYDKKIQEISKRRNHYKEYENILKVKTQNYKILNLEIENLEAKLTDERKGADLVNNYLNDFFGHQYLKLKSVKGQDTNTRFNIIRDDKIAYNMSEGEKSLIAFCYFIAKLNDQHTKDKKPIIWIDDPICSLDDNHIYYIYSIMAENLCKNRNFTQLFISTHNLEFLKYLNRLNACEILSDKTAPKSYYMVIRNNSNSRLINMPKHIRENASEFQFLFENIYSCSLIEEINEDSYQLLYNCSNYIRKFLEIYLYFLYPENIKLEPKIERYVKDSKNAILINRLINEGSHGVIGNAHKLANYEEAIKVSKLIIDKLRENEEQFNILTKPFSINKS